MGFRKEEDREAQEAVILTIHHRASGLNGTGTDAESEEFLCKNRSRMFCSLLVRSSGFNDDKEDPLKQRVKGGEFQW